MVNLNLNGGVLPERWGGMCVLKWFKMIRGIFIVLFVITAFHPLLAGPNVLIFDSYHEGFDWSDTLFSALKSELKKADLPDIELYIEHLDSKRFYLNDSLYFEFISRKYKSVQFELIIACDNFSLDLLVKYDTLLFKGVPVVFTGINNFSDQLIHNKKRIFTGITESHDIGKTLHLISKFQPEVRNILVIHDNTASGKANKELVEKAALDFKNLQCHYVSDLSVKELMEQVKKLDKNGKFICFSPGPRKPLFNCSAGITLLLPMQSSFLPNNDNSSDMGCWGLYDNAMGQGNGALICPDTRGESGKRLPR
jgi:hypothetical protein